MPSTAVTFGGILILIGVIGYVYGLTNNSASITALIPAFFGIVLVILGLIAKSKENLRKHLMHGAVIIGLLGFLIPAWRVLSKISSIEFTAGVIAQIAMAVVCLVFVILCVKSFIDARRNGNV